MKIYAIDFGVYGCILVTAKSKEEALEIMRREARYPSDVVEEKIEEYDLEGFVYWNEGDL